LIKQKLLIVLGAGASVEFGMPSVSEVDKLFDKWCSDRYIAVDTNQSYYKYLMEVSQKEHNFESGIYLLWQLAKLYNESDLKEFLEPKKLSKVASFGQEATEITHNDLVRMSCFLIDELLKEFRTRCKILENTHKEQLQKQKDFFEKLSQKYELGFVSLNYDNVILSCMSHLFTGFNQSGNFDARSVLTRKEWNFIYHLHGSVYFDMAGSKHNMHEIVWQNDLTTQFSQNSSGRNSVDNVEKTPLPNTSIITGYEKSQQILRQPFRTYYSVLDKLVMDADAFMVLGYGFGDEHLNSALKQMQYNRKRNVVVVGYSDDGEDPMQFRNDAWSYNLLKTFPANAHQIATRKYQHAAPDIAELKKNYQLEVSTNQNYPLSIWHGGYLKACENVDLILEELER
jgi:hypothetical protein